MNRAIEIINERINVLKGIKSKCLLDSDKEEYDMLIDELVLIREEIKEENK